jgi:hypothetical protein
MAHAEIAIDCLRITDWTSFHTVFAETLGFPDFYGRNMNAWVDCLTYVDESGDAMTKIHAPEGGVLVLCLDNCVFRSMPATSSGGCRAMIPVHAGPPFRSMPAGGCDAG